MLSVSRARSRWRARYVPRPNARSCSAERSDCGAVIRSPSSGTGHSRGRRSKIWKSWAPLQLLERQILARDPSLDLRSSTPSLPEQARKHVTVVVAEFTTPSSDPEDAERLGPLLLRARALMESHGASVEPLFSSSLVGIFGARRAYEDDAERSVRAAFAIRDGVGDTSVRARIGIDSGRALVTIKAERVDVAGAVL